MSALDFVRPRLRRPHVARPPARAPRVASVVPCAAPRTPADAEYATPARLRRRVPAPPLPSGSLTGLGLPILLDAQRRREAYENRHCPDALIDDLMFVGGLAVRGPIRFGSAIASFANDRLRSRASRSN